MGSQRITLHKTNWTRTESSFHDTATRIRAMVSTRMKTVRMTTVLNASKRWVIMASSKSTVIKLIPSLTITTRAAKSTMTCTIIGRKALVKQFTLMSTSALNRVMMAVHLSEVGDKGSISTLMIWEEAPLLATTRPRVIDTRTVMTIMRSQRSQRRMALIQSLVQRKNLSIRETLVKTNLVSVQTSMKRVLRW